MVSKVPSLLFLLLAFISITISQAQNCIVELSLNDDIQAFSVPLNVPFTRVVRQFGYIQSNCNCLSLIFADSTYEGYYKTVRLYPNVRTSIAGVNVNSFMVTCTLNTSRSFVSV